ncbi:DNA-3-methyladenine glycosylase [Bacillus sp. S/N-304-OC-R1]|uniref:DNA-3-methyladenine glycosylase family protein n=1 Tax=Bacillus sp. S/N-304-OC-R1 TaxID=2758034 RepID=UPI001C8ECF07|nr:DNA-3-methyladenine glycosylase [Bacillus sp. S/N-304-OC-R1]MBY0121532.1 DNA-3-methyladenine glycosylase 2 [Bacillus sp. S/N-304-OC-R1]
MKWIDHESYLEIYPPAEFNFKECLIFLDRSSQEILHEIKEQSIYKLLKVNDSLLLSKIVFIHNYIKVEFPISSPSFQDRKKVGEYIWEWFDLDQDLRGFYQVASQDNVLKTLAAKYYGLRIMCIPDLFEAIVWAIIGQQINLNFANTLKKRFVEQFGESLTFEGETFWVFPSFERLASINVDDLRKLQFTLRKAEYIIGVARAMTNGEIAKEVLLQKNNYHHIKNSLMSIKGIGAWTADYVMMKCLHYPTSFPVADVGLHNAIKNILDLERKPTLEEIEKYAAGWDGWQAYATFYLWRSLYDKNI